MVGAFRDRCSASDHTFGEGGARSGDPEGPRGGPAAAEQLPGAGSDQFTRISTCSARNYRNMPPINMEALEFVLRISEMVLRAAVDHQRWTQSALIVDEHGAVYWMPRIVVDNIAPADRYDHMAIHHPYPSTSSPKDLHARGRDHGAADQTGRRSSRSSSFASCRLRPKYLRFMVHHARAAAGDEPARLTQIDYDREMAAVATIEEDGAEVEVRGWPATAVNPDSETCRVRHRWRGWQHRGLARRLMGVLIETARNRGLHAT